MVSVIVTLYNTKCVRSRRLPPSKCSTSFLWNQSVGVVRGKDRCSKARTQQNAQCEHHVEFLNVRASGTLINRLALKGKMRYRYFVHRYVGAPVKIRCSVFLTFAVRVVGTWFRTLYIQQK